jgi:hypothetical protein
VGSLKLTAVSARALFPMKEACLECQTAVIECQTGVQIQITWPCCNSQEIPGHRKGLVNKSQPEPEFRLPVNRSFHAAAVISISHISTLAAPLNQSQSMYVYNGPSLLHVQASPYASASIVITWIVLAGLMIDTARLPPQRYLALNYVLQT